MVSIDHTNLHQHEIFQLENAGFTYGHLICEFWQIFTMGTSTDRCATGTTDQLSKILCSQRWYVLAFREARPNVHSSLLKQDLKSLADFPTVYEITEQVNDPIRCPIKQYDFYVSKW
jgi:hypothetical protein